METLFKQLRVANYNRKSQDSEDKQVLSIPSQREEAQKIATALGISSLDLYEEAKSAKAANHRPVFRKLLEDIKTGKVNAILCWKLDRIARNMDEGGGRSGSEII
jgi:DNA invertase Pin-like site-specific DNA recombinase